MSEFKKYEKIHRLGKEETEDILLGFCHVTEKIDGANTSIWLDDEGVIRMGSRTRILGDEEFNGFVPYVKAHVGIKRCLEENPLWHLYLEWMVRHTISYKETAYKKAYLFDIYDGEKYLPQDEVIEVGKKYGIETVPYHGILENPTLEQLNEFVGKTEFGDRGEGIVIKNLDFVNKFGDVVYAKIVTESFKEDNAVVFGGNNKHSDSYWEMWVVNKFMTLGRIEKIINKIQAVLPEGEVIGLKHTPRVAGTAYHDLITEECWEIANKTSQINFTILKRVEMKKAIQI